jgi:hypothetical protein
MVLLVQERTSLTFVGWLIEPGKYFSLSESCGILRDHDFLGFPVVPWQIPLVGFKQVDRFS